MEYSLSEIVNIKYGKNQKNVKNPNGSYPIFGTGGIIDYADDYLYDKPSILIGRKGTIDKIHFIDSPFWTIDTLFYTEINEDLAVPKYLYYKLSTIDFSFYNEGTTIPSLRTETLKKIKIDLPPLSLQSKIADILSKFDEKVEVNHTIIANLEALSQTLFKRWFIDFEFPDENGNPYRSSGGKMYNTKLGEIPTKFHPGTLKDLLDIKSGYAFKSSWWEDSGVPVIKIKDIQDNGINLHNLSYVAPSHASKASDFTVSGGEILMALTGATVSKNYVVPLLKEPALVNQRVGLVKGSNSFKYLLLNSKLIRNEIIERAHGSAQPNVSPKNILAINFPIPTVNIIETFVCETKSMYKMIYTKSYENTQLVKLRDDLLPKLMSGELELPEELEV